MAGKYCRSKSRVFLLYIPIVVLFFFFFFFLFFSGNNSQFSDRLDLASSSSSSVEPQTSFVASLDRFLRTHTPPNRHDTVSGHDLDALLSAAETRRLYGDPHYPLTLPIRVYVYDMPAKFTYDLLFLFRNTFRDTSNLTSNGSPVHRLIEQHSIDYWVWADLIAPESERLLKSVVRVERQEEADLFYIPFFSTISFFLLEKHQCKALYRV